jgi:hypothetical protein
VGVSGRIDQEPAETFLADLSEAIVIGRRFGETHASATSVYDMFKHDAGVRQRLIELGRDSRMAKRAVSSGFFFGVSYALRHLPEKETSRTNAVRTGCFSQLQLTKSLLRLPQNSRMDLVDDPQVFPGDHHIWRAHCFGALAVARVVSTTIRVQLTAYFPTIEADTRYGADLFISLPRSTRPIAVQIKSKRTEDELVCRIIHGPGDVEDGSPEIVAWKRMVWSGTHLFNKRSGLRCIPMLVVVGKENQDLTSLSLTRISTQALFVALERADYRLAGLPVPQTLPG